MSSNVSSAYLHVVDSVVRKLREEFVNEGVNDSVLTDLQGLWELKMLQCGAIQGPIERNSSIKAVVPTPVHDLNVPYEGPEEYETPTAEMLFPPTPMQTPMQTPLPVDTPAYQYFHAGPGEYGTTPDTGSAVDTKSVRPSPYMQQPSPWMSQRPLGVDVNVAYEEAREEEQGGGGGGITGTSQPPMKDFFTMTSSKRKREDYNSKFLPGGYIPQQDGSGDFSSDNSLCEKVFVGISSSDKVPPKTLLDRLKLREKEIADAATASKINMKQSTFTIPQYDGSPDVFEDGVRNENYSTPSYYDPMAGTSVRTPKLTNNETLEDDEPPLNEDDDDEDDLDDLDQEDEEPSTNHLMLAQFEKVTRTKSRWKCTLKDGIMHLNNKDILFTKATGEFEF